jgi:hypothetical protein
MMAGRPGPAAPPHRGMPTEFVPPGVDQSSVPVKIVPAPEKYASANTSPLKFSVQKGTQNYDVDLIP